MGALLDGAVHIGKGLVGEGPLKPISRIFERGLNKAFPYAYIGADNAIDLYTQGILDPEILKELASYEGYDFSTFQRGKLYWFEFDKDDTLQVSDWIKSEKIELPTLLVAGQTFRFPPEQIILFLQRGWISEEVARAFLARHGMIDPQLKKMFLKLKDELPTVQDLIHFSVRHGFEPDILSTFGYTKEIPKTYLKWADKIGLGGSSDVQISDATDSDGQDMEPHKATWAEQHWFAHWILPSLGDAYEMLHRLYPDSKYGPSPDLTPNNQFTPELLSLFQRAQDIPKYWREKLQAISYLPLTRVDVRRMYDLRTIDEATVYHSYRAQGYNDENSQRLLQYTKKAREETDLKSELWPKAEKICEFRTLGILEDEETKPFLEKLGIPRDEIDIFFSNCDLQKQLEKVKNVLKAIERSFLKGIADQGQIFANLQDLGMSESAIVDKLEEWTILQQYQFKEDNAAEAQKWYEKGIIGRDEFVTRLQNLKISDGSILHMVALADMTIAENAAKQDEKLAKELLHKQKEIRKEQKTSQKEQTKEQTDYLKRLLAASTQANLKKWWKLNLIPEDLLNERLTLLNYSPDDIDRWKQAYG